MKLKITKVETNESVTIQNDCGEFMWRHGNYACDCNRELFFERAKGNDIELESTRCSDGRFNAEKIDDET